MDIPGGSLRISNGKRRSVGSGEAPVKDPENRESAHALFWHNFQMHLGSTDSVGAGMIEAKLPCESMGAGDSTHTACLLSVFG